MMQIMNIFLPFADRGSFVFLRARPGVKGKCISEVRLTIKELDPSAH